MEPMKCFTALIVITANVREKMYKLNHDATQRTHQ